MKKIVPKRRFEEFKDGEAWEQRKAIDIAPLQRGFDLPISEMKAGSYPVVMSNGIGAYHYMLNGELIQPPKVK